MPVIIDLVNKMDYETFETLITLIDYIDYIKFNSDILYKTKRTSQEI